MIDHRYPVGGRHNNTAGLRTTVTNRVARPQVLLSMGSKSHPICSSPVRGSSTICFSIENGIAIAVHSGRLNSATLSALNQGFGNRTGDGGVRETRSVKKERIA